MFHLLWMRLWRVGFPNKWKLLKQDLIRLVLAALCEISHWNSQLSFDTSYSPQLSHVILLHLQVFPLQTLQIFTEYEIERLLCGEQETWVVCIGSCFVLLIWWLQFTLNILLLLSVLQSGELLDHIKFDHGYTASSPPINNVSILGTISNLHSNWLVWTVNWKPRWMAH